MNASIYENNIQFISKLLRRRAEISCAKRQSTFMLASMTHIEDDFVLRYVLTYPSVLAERN